MFARSSPRLASNHSLANSWKVGIVLDAGARARLAVRRPPESALDVGEHVPQLGLRLATADTPEALVLALAERPEPEPEHAGRRGSSMT